MYLSVSIFSRTTPGLELQDHKVLSPEFSIEGLGVVI